MWLFLNDAYLSVVAHRDQPDHLLVRSRIEGDIERAIPGAETFQLADADYRYRAVVSREAFKAAISRAVDGIDYANFKNSIDHADKKRYRACTEVWGVMARHYGSYGAPASAREPE